MGSYRKKRSSPSYISSSRGRHDDKCFAPNTICNNALEKAYLSNGQAIYSMYCSFHTCARRSPDGRFCGRAKYPAQRFCPDHLSCQARSIRCGPCDGTVKNGDADMYSFCSEFHACDVEFCPNRRVRADYGVASYCDAHECESNNCHKLKREGGRFCPSHTCDYETCDCFASPDGHGGGGISQRCVHHQQCQHRGCRELLDFTNVSGGGGGGGGGSSFFCRWHSCKQGLCGNEAQSRGGFCQDHECRERSCTRGVFATGGGVPVFADFCDDHKCRATDCLYERQPRHYYCSRHACGIVGCDRPAARESRCQMHHHELPSQGRTPPPGYSSLGPRYFSQRRNSGAYRCYGPWD